MKTFHLSLTAAASSKLAVLTRIVMPSTLLEFLHKFQTNNVGINRYGFTPKEFGFPLCLQT